MRSLDPAVKLLSLLLVIFTAALFAAEFFFKSDAQFFQTVAGIVSAISGALLMRITGHAPGQPTPGQASQTHTTTEVITRSPEPPTLNPTA